MLMVPPFEEHFHGFLAVRLVRVTLILASEMAHPSIRMLWGDVGRVSFLLLPHPPIKRIHSIPSVLYSGERVALRFFRAFVKSK